MIAASTIALSASAFAAADPTSAQTPQPAATAAAATAPPTKNAPDPNKLICKTTEVTGSRLGGSRTCLTRQQWDEMARANSQAVENAQNQGSFTLSHQPH
jgi:hypothetical protein